MKNKNIFWGITLVFLALCLLLSYTDLAPNIPFYKIVLTIFLIYTTVKSIFNINFFGALMSLALLGCLHSKLLHITAITPWPLLFSAFLCSIGLNLIFKNTTKKSKNYFEKFNHEQVVNFQDDSYVTVDNNFGSVNKYVNSNNFSNAKIDNNFGKTNIYFDNTILKSNKAEIVVDNNFGEVNLYLPHTWRISLSKRVSFGDIKIYGNGSNNPDSPEITIFAVSSFGSIHIYFN